MTISTQSVASVTRKLAGVFTALVLVLGLATSAQAQQSGGSIRGSVFGADSGTVVEVVDTERGMTKSETTGADGSFRFDGLSTGNYEVRVRQGGNVVDSAVVAVSLGRATTVSMATTAEAIEEIVTTGTRVAALDTSIAESGLVITSEALLEMPVQRDLTSVALLAPGTSRGDYRFGDNGNVAFAGASIAENTSFINGLNTTNFRTGVGFSQVPFEFYDTLQVKTGGYSAKYGRSTGGVMNARTKSGSNDWNFGLNVYYNTDLDTSPDTYISANIEDDPSTTTFDVSVSGPILKDRVFFYALYSQNNEDDVYAGLSSLRGYKFEEDSDFWGVKLDAYITDNHKLEYTAFSDERDGLEDTYDYDPVTRQFTNFSGITSYKRGGDNWIATYTGDLTDSLQISASYGENTYDRTTQPSTADCPYLLQRESGVWRAVGCWSSAVVSAGEDTREMTRFDVNYVVGKHNISAGYDTELNTAIDQTVYSGGRYWRLDDITAPVYPCTPAECPQGATARLRIYDAGGEFETKSDAIYIQDVWEFNDKWTFELGLRNETFENLNSGGGVFVKVDDQWAPRLAAVFDPNGDGQSKFYANYGLYYIPVAANTNIRMSGNELFTADFYDWDGSSVDANNEPTGLGSIYDAIIYGDGSVPDTRSTTDANIEAMYQSEFIVGWQRYLDSGLEVGVKGIYRNLETTLEDVAIDAAVIDYYNNGAGTWNSALVGGDTVEDVFGGFHQYVLTNPGNDMSVYIPEMDEQVSLSAAQLNYPEAKRQYGAIEFTFARPFDGTWALAGSYTWSHSWGNHEGYVKSDNGQDDAGITQNFDQPGLTDASYGNLPNDRRHTVKLYGTYQMENGVRFGSNFFYQSGRPLSCFGVHPTDVFAQAYEASSHFCQGDAVKRGSLGTTPDLMTVDLNAQYEMEIGGTDVLFSLDVFNIFNSQNATVFNEDGDTGGGSVNENYGKIRQYQAPRALRLSARVNFGM